MFLAEVWGAVAAWVMTGATAAAAVIALGHYIYESRHRKKSQARQIRGVLRADIGSSVSVEVRNNSERPISDIYFLYIENSLAKSLLRKRRFVIPQRMSRVVDGTEVHMWQHVGPEKVLERRKRDIFGFDGRRGLCTPSSDHRRLGPGEAHTFTDICLSDHQYRASTSYWVGFQDADGNLWKVSALQEGVGDAPELRSVKSIVAEFGEDHGIRTRIKTLAYYRQVMWWLYRNRKEKTSHIPPSERNQRE